MDNNKTIQNPENICFNCLKEAAIHKISIPALGWGSQFDNRVPRTLVTLVMSKWHDNN